MAYIHQQISKLLELKNPTKVRVAKELKRSRTTLDTWARDTFPRVDDLIALAKIYNVPMSYFFDEVSSPTQVVTGVGNVAFLNGSTVVKTTSNDIDKDKEIELLRAMIEDKERTIKILMQQNNSL